MSNILVLDKSLEDNQPSRKSQNKQLNWIYEDGIIYGACHGKLVLEDLIDAMHNLIENETLPREILLLSDYRGCLSNHGIRDIYIVADVAAKLADNFNYIRHAKVIDNPFIVAATMIICKRMRRKNYTLKIFSSVRAAKIWLKDNYNSD